MIRYHGGPITPVTAALQAWTGAHAMISYAYPGQLPIAAEVCHSFALDNGAFSAWKAGRPTDWSGYVSWAKEWSNHPGFDWCLIPDRIEGQEADNDALIQEFLDGWGSEARCVPVWHMHESIERLVTLCNTWERVAIGSSGEFADIATAKWWARIAEAFEKIIDDNGFPICKLHGLRQMDPTVFSHIPYASVDSTMVARNIGIDSAWNGTYQPPTKEARALVLRQRIGTHASAARWTGSAGIQMNFELIG